MTSPIGTIHRQLARLEDKRWFLIGRLKEAAARHKFKYADQLENALAMIDRLKEKIEELEKAE